MMVRVSVEFSSVGYRAKKKIIYSDQVIGIIHDVPSSRILSVFDALS